MNQHDENIQDVLDSLSVLAPETGDAPTPASHTLARLKHEIDRRKNLDLSPPSESISWRLKLMFRKRFALASALAVLLLVLAFTFPSVRAAASDFLGLFRVQKFAPISISPEQLAVLEEIAESGLYPGEIVMIDEPGAPQPADSLAAAQSVTGLAARSPGILGEPDGIYTSDGGSGRLIVNVDNTRAILQVAGADPELVPDSLDGAVVEVTILPGVSLNWHEGTVLAQAPSPIVDYPDDVDPVALGQALLQALGMPVEKAAGLARSIDWTNTLLLPIPENIASFNQVYVDGVEGLALSSLDGQNAAILWEKDGIVYILSGGEAAELIDIANSMP